MSMADEKITIVTLRKALAQKTGVSEEIVGKFLTHLFPAIAAGIREDKQVRINGFGIFKLQWNEPRKSVNIRTGETIIIDGYNKVVFTPDSTLKEQINEPFAHLETVVIDGEEIPRKANVDPMQKFGEQAEEIESLLAEIGDLGTAGNEIMPIETAAKEEVTEVIPKSTEIEAEVVFDSIEENPTSIVIEKSAESNETSRAETLPKKIDKPFNAWRIGGITISCFCVLLVVFYFFARHQLEQWADGLQTKLQPIEEKTLEQLETTPIQASEEPLVEPIDSTPQVRTYAEFIKIEKLTYGSRLSWLSRKYYGAPDFWVYIYEANKDKLPDPSVIPIGTEIRIPKLPKELIDTRNAESMRKAKELHKQILGE